MIKLFTWLQLNYSKSRDLLPIKCECCGNIFYRQKNYILFALDNKNNTFKYCSTKCKYISNNKKQVVICTTCGNEFKKKKSEINKTINNFCSRSCAATLNNSLYPKRKKK